MAPANSDEMPMIGPDSELPVKGSEPVPDLAFALVCAANDVDVEPSNPTIGEIVVDDSTVEPSEPTSVLDTVVDGTSVVDVVLVEVAGATEVLVAPSIVVVVPAIVVVVSSVVVVLDVEGEHAATNVTDADAVAWKPSVHVACTDSKTSPVIPPGTMVVAEVWPLLATSE